MADVFAACVCTGLLFVLGLFALAAGLAMRGGR